MVFASAQLTFGTNFICRLKESLTIQPYSNAQGLGVTILIKNRMINHQLSLPYSIKYTIPSRLRGKSRYPILFSRPRELPHRVMHGEHLSFPRFCSLDQNLFPLESVRDCHQACHYV